MARLAALFAAALLAALLLPASRLRAQSVERPPDVPAGSVAAAPPADPVAPADEDDALDVLELTTGGARATDALPLIVALHGRGDRPEWMRAQFERLDVRARVMLVRAPLPFGGGFEWFRIEPEGSLVSMARELAEMLPRLVATIERALATRPTVGRPVVVGFSQGAMVSYALAIARPTLFERVIAVAGFLLPNLLIEAPESASIPPIDAFHGVDDDIVPIEADRLSVRALQRRGAQVQLHEYAGEGHALGARVQRDVARAIRTALGVEARPRRR